MKTYLYIDRQNCVVYLDFRDSAINRENPTLKLYEIQADFVGMFIRYFKLKLHPKAKQHIILN